MKYLLWISIFVLTACSLEKTESEDTFEFTSTYAVSGQINSICEWKDGSYYICGFQNDLTLPKNYVASINRNGSLIWESTQVGSTTSIGQQVSPTTNGELYVSTNYTKVGFQHLDAQGTLIASAGTSAGLPLVVPGQWNDARSSIVPLNGRIYVAGGVGTSNASNIILMSALPDGSDMTYTILPSLFPEEDVECMQATSDGNFILVGRRGGSSSFEYPILLKVTPQGGLIWRNDLPTTAVGRATWVVGNSDGTFLICGQSGIPDVVGLSGQDVALWKVDANGNLMWERKYGGTLDQNANEMLRNENGDYLICGQADNPSSTSGEKIGMLMKVNAAGDLLWTRLYPKSDYISAATTTFDKGFLFAGKKANTVYLLKTDGDGDL
jgi:hypothetical protein